MSKKILLVSSTDAKSLIDFYWDFIVGLVQKNYTVTACLPSNDMVSRKLESINIRHIVCQTKNANINPVKNLMYFFRLYRIIKQEKPDILYSYTLKSAIYVSLLAKFFTKTKYVATMIPGLGTVFTDHGLKTRIIRRFVIILLKLSFSYNKKVFFLNDMNLNLFKSLNITNPKQNVLLKAGVGINTTHFSQKPLPEKTTFLLIARLIRQKGIIEYCEAAQILNQQYKNIRFLLLGPFYYHPTAISKKELENLSSISGVEYLGCVNDVRPIIEKSSIFVLPSYGEGLPHTVLESMAMARPIITTDIPGCRETVVNGVNGYLVPPKNSRALATAMEKFILDPEKIAKMGQESRRIAVEKFDVFNVNKIVMMEMGL